MSFIWLALRKQGLFVMKVLFALTAFYSFRLLILWLARKSFRALLLKYWWLALSIWNVDRCNFFKTGDLTFIFLTRRIESLHFASGKFLGFLKTALNSLGIISVIASHWVHHLISFRVFDLNIFNVWLGTVLWDVLKSSGNWWSVTRCHTVLYLWLLTLHIFIVWGDDRFPTRHA